MSFIAKDAPVKLSVPGSAIRTKIGAPRRSARYHRPPIPTPPQRPVDIQAPPQSTPSQQPDTTSAEGTQRPVNEQSPQARDGSATATTSAPPPATERSRAALMATCLQMFTTTHQKRQSPPSRQDQAAKRAESSNCSIVLPEFKKIQILSGAQFTWDACSSDTGSKLCKNFSSVANSFLASDVSSQHVWLHPPVQLVEPMLEHMLYCWHKAPTTTSACVMIPASLSYMATSDTHTMRLLYKYPATTKILQPYDVAGNPTNKTIRTTAPMHVYQLDPAPTKGICLSLDMDLLQEPQPGGLAFQFQSQCTPMSKTSNTFPARVMIDSGASTRFVSQEWVQQNKLTIKPTHTNWTVTVANNKTVAIMGTTDVTINI